MRPCRWRVVRPHPLLAGDEEWAPTLLTYDEREARGELIRVRTVEPRARLERQLILDPAPWERVDA